MSDVVGCLQAFLVLVADQLIERKGFGRWYGLATKTPRGYANNAINCARCREIAGGRSTTLHSAGPGIVLCDNGTTKMVPERVGAKTV